MRRPAGEPTKTLQVLLTRPHERVAVIAIIFSISDILLVFSAIQGRHTSCEYWIVDPDLDVIMVYRNRDGRFERPEERRADAGDVLTTVHLDGLKIPVAKIFTDA